MLVPTFFIGAANHFPQRPRQQMVHSLRHHLISYLSAYGFDPYEEFQVRTSLVADAI